MTGRVFAWTCTSPPRSGTLVLCDFEEMARFLYGHLSVRAVPGLQRFAGERLDVAILLKSFISWRVFRP